MSECPEYQEAIPRLAEFLRQHGHPDSIQWVFRDDFYFDRRQKPVVRWPLPEMNHVLSRQHFEFGRAQGLGVELGAQFMANGITFVSVWFPSDELEAEYGLISGLKLSVRSPLAEAHIETRPVLWSVRTAFPAYRRHQSLAEHIPERKMARA